MPNKEALGKWMPSKEEQGKWMPNKEALGKWMPSKEEQGKWMPNKEALGKWMPSKEEPGKWMPSKERTKSTDKCFGSFVDYLHIISRIWNGPTTVELMESQMQATEKEYLEQMARSTTTGAQLKLKTPLAELLGFGVSCAASYEDAVNKYTSNRDWSFSLSSESMKVGPDAVPKGSMYAVFIPMRVHGYQLGEEKHVIHLPTAPTMATCFDCEWLRRMSKRYLLDESCLPAVTSLGYHGHTYSKKNIEGLIHDFPKIEPPKMEPPPPIAPSCPKCGSPTRMNQSPGHHCDVCGRNIHGSYWTCTGNHIRGSYNVCKGCAPRYAHAVVRPMPREVGSPRGPSAVSKGHGRA